jgi:hypothetical protein
MHKWINRDVKKLRMKVKKQVMHNDTEWEMGF